MAGILNTQEIGSSLSRDLRCLSGSAENAFTDGRRSAYSLPIVDGEEQFPYGQYGTKGGSQSRPESHNHMPPLGMPEGSTPEWGLAN